MTDTCDCLTHLDCNPDCACPSLECEYVFIPAELEEQRYQEWVRLRETNDPAGK